MKAAMNQRCTDLLEKIDIILYYGMRVIIIIVVIAKEKLTFVSKFIFSTLQHSHLLYIIILMLL